MLFRSDQNDAMEGPDDDDGPDAEEAAAVETIERPAAVEARQHEPAAAEAPPVHDTLAAAPAVDTAPVQPSTPDHADPDPQ